MTEALVESGEKSCGVRLIYFKRGYPPHDVEVLEVRPKVLWDEIVAQSNDQSSGVLQDLSSFRQPEDIELGSVT